MPCYAYSEYENVYNLAVNYNGSISEENIFALNVNELGTEKANVVAGLTSELMMLKNGFITKFYNKVENSDLSIEKKSEYKNGYDCQYSVNQGEETLYKISFNFVIKYASDEIYDFAWGLENQDSTPNYEYNYKFLTVDIIQRTRVKTGTLIELENNEYTSLNNYLWWYVYNILKTNLGQSVADNLTKPSYSYNYITSAKRLHSNAERMYNEHGYYVHSFSTTFDNLNKEIYFYQTEARREIWYAIILVASVLTVAVCLIVNHYKEKKENTSNGHFE